MEHTRAIEPITERQHALLLKQVAVGTYAAGILLSGAVLVGVEKIVSVATSPLITVANEAITQTTLAYNEYLSSLTPRCRDAVNSTDGVITEGGATFFTCHDDVVVNGNVNRYRRTIAQNKAVEVFAKAAPGATTAITAGGIGLIFVRRRKKGHTVIDSYPVQHMSDILLAKYKSDEQKAIEWRERNKQWLPLLPETRLNQEYAEELSNE